MTRSDVNLGLFAKLLFLSVVNGAAVYALPILFDRRAWTLFVFLLVSVGVTDLVYLTRRRWSIPLRYLVPGTFFLLIFQVYPVLYSGYISMTNLGTGNVLDKEAATEQLVRASVSSSVEGGRFEAKAVRNDDDELGLYLVDEAGVEYLGTSEGRSELAPDQIVTEDDRVVEVDGYRILDLGQVSAIQAELTALEVPADEGVIRLQTFNSAALLAYRLQYDADADTITDVESGTVYRPVEGRYTADDGARLTPGWQAFIGADNYTRVLTSEAIRGPFLRVFLWNWAFAILSVFTQFAFGLALAIALNSERLRGQRVFRSIMIVPYALPSFMTALIWQGMLNKDFGIINDFLRADVPWLTNPWMARLSIILANLWLGFPYMFLVSTGALQSVPEELSEAAVVDGASGLQAFRRITFPLLMVPLAPLLIASFAFNFNNFNIIYLLNRGGPPIVGAQTPAGHTDILISYTYRLAFESGRGQDLGLASAISIFIFAMVVLVSAISFRQTKALEDLS